MQIENIMTMMENEERRSCEMKLKPRKIAEESQTNKVMEKEKEILWN